VRMEIIITNIKKGMKSLKDENGELKRANKIINTKITTLEVVAKFSVLGEWKVIQRRGDYGEPRENFQRNWDDYKHGFGDPIRKFWLRNDKIHQLNKSGDMKLRVELEALNGTTAWAEYDTFRVEDEDQGYRLHISGYSGQYGLH